MNLILILSRRKVTYFSPYCQINPREISVFPSFAYWKLFVCLRETLKLYPIDEVWGIGRRYAAKLEALGIHTAYDFAQYNGDWVRAMFNNIVIYRTWQELNGIETIVLGSQQYTQKDGKGKADVFANAIKHDHRSKNPTTRWSDIIRLK